MPGNPPPTQLGADTMSDNITTDSVSIIVSDWRDWRDDWAIRNLGLEGNPLTSAREANKFARRIGELSVQLAQNLHITTAEDAQALAELATNIKGSVFGNTDWNTGA